MFVSTVVCVLVVFQEHPEKPTCLTWGLPNHLICDGYRTHVVSLRVEQFTNASVGQLCMYIHKCSHKVAFIYILFKTTNTTDTCIAGCNTLLHYTQTFVH